MAAEHATETVHAASGVALRETTKADRIRLSAPALRTFVNIAAEWGLSERDRLAVLGQPGRSTYHAWLAKANAGRSLTLPLDTLVRISAVLGVYKAVKLIFVREGDDVAWLRAPNSGPLFAGRAPLDLITSGAQDAILDVRRYLDAWRGGQASAPLAGATFEHAPIADDDLVFA
jgi:hypothetical protein